MSDFKNSLLRGFAISLAAALAVSTAVGTAALFIDIPDGLLDKLSFAVLALAAYIAAYASTQFYRSKGLIQGLICGAGVFAAAFICGTVFLKQLPSDYAAVKAVLCAVFGAIGGIKGVNTKKTGIRH